MEFYKKLLNKLITNNNYFNLLIFFIITAQIYINYQGVYHPFYIDIYDYNLDRSLFKNDIYLQNSLIFDSSILLHLFNIIKINLHNDFINLSLYISSNFLGIFFLKKILEEFFLFEEKQLINYVLVFSLFSQITLQYIQPLFLTTHTGTITSIVMPLILPYIYYFFKRIKLICCICNFFLFLISIRNFWILILITNLIIFLELIKNKKFIYFFFQTLSILVPLVILGSHSEYLSFDQRIQMIELIFERAEGEDALNLQNKLNLIATLVCFFLFYFFLKRINSISKKIKIFLWNFLSIHLIIFVFYYNFCSWIYEIFPIYEIVLLNPIRIFYIFNTFLIILGVKYFKEFIHSNTLFFLLLTNFLVLNIFGYSINFMIFCIISFCVYLLNSKSFEVKTLSLNLIFLFVISYQLIKIYTDKPNKIDLTLFKNEKRFTNIGDFNNQNLKKLLYLKQCDDFTLLFIDRTKSKNVNTNFKNLDKYNLNNILNWSVKKSKYLGEISHFYGSSKSNLIKNHFVRKKEVELLLNKISFNEEISGELKNILSHKHNIVIIISSDKDLYFNEGYYSYKNERFHYYYNNSNLSKCLKSNT